MNESTEFTRELKPTHFWILVADPKTWGELAVLARQFNPDTPISWVNQPRQKIYIKGTDRREDGPMIGWQ